MDHLLTQYKGEKHIYIYICCYVQFQGLFYQWVQECSFLASTLNHFQTKKRVSPGDMYAINRKISPKMSTPRRTSNAFKNGALMLRSISAPFFPKTVPETPETPIFVAFPAPKLKTFYVFRLSDARFSSKKRLQKLSSPRTVPAFTQTPRL